MTYFDPFYKREEIILNYLIGVDAGGTKTEAVAYSQNGSPLSTGFAGHGNLLINEEAAIANILSAIRQCLSPLNIKDCVYIYLGIAGFEGVENPRPIEEALRLAFDVPFTIVNDGIIAHAALLQGENGMMTISGTGSVSIGKYNEQVVMKGGWGHLLGDLGSGYWISLEAFKKMTEEEDENLPHSRTTLMLLEKLNYQEGKEIKKYIYSSTKSEIASFVPSIVELANQDDKWAQYILSEAGRHLAKTTLAAYRSLPFSKNVKLAVKGSVLTKIPIVQASFIATIKEKVPDAQFILDDVSSTLGCYYLAMQKLKKL